MDVLGIAYDQYPRRAHPQLNGLGRRVTADAADDLLDLHFVKARPRRRNKLRRPSSRRR